MRDIETDLADWWDITERNKSGGTGYPNCAAGFGDSGGGGKRTDRTPTASMPGRLWVVDIAMGEISQILTPLHKNVLERKHFKADSDQDRAKELGVSLPQYYTLAREANSFVCGAYAMAFTGRRKKIDGDNKF